jgi:hypothetical protein
VRACRYNSTLQSRFININNNKNFAITRLTTDSSTNQTEGFSSVGRHLQSATTTASLLAVAGPRHIIILL